MRLGFFGLLALSVALGGCAGSFEEARSSAHPGIKLAPPSERCQSLDDGHATWGAVAAFAAVGTGASGVSTIPLWDDRTGRIVIVSTTIALAMVAAGAEFISQSDATSWARECTP